jgi:Fungalysin metallopeptidase (M36)/Fungalysin/Thermolysin Propeptide Motif
LKANNYTLIFINNPANFMQKFSRFLSEGLFAKLVLAFLLAFTSISLKAQTEITTAKNYLSDNIAKYKLTKSDVNDMNVSSSYLSPTTGWYHIYFNQTFQNVEVYNALLNVTMKNGEVVQANSTFEENIAIRLMGVNANNAQGKLTPTQAIERAAQHLNLTAGNITKVQETALSSGVVGKGKYLANSLSKENIDVKLYWLPYEYGEEGKRLTKLALTYSVRIVTKDNANIWNVHVDVNNGNILREVDEVVHCDFGVPHQDGHSQHGDESHVGIPNGYSYAKREVISNLVLAPNQYNVFDYPLESPNHGARTIVTSPYTRFVPTGTGPGATNGWHNDGTTDFTNTRGNNVWAKEDLAADNETTIGTSPISATLDFNYPYTQATNTAAGNLDAAITNIFYWNNVMHDVLWRYGFDEPSGNFQKDNQGRGGAGNDFVFADAQDGSGTDNANFSTPIDGTNGRMQMFIWSNAGSPSYQPDSDFDNGVIAHEYGHGWSTRLTGGPANSSCLQNAEQGGEGWSDYAALMTVTNWSTLTPTLASANVPRGIGTYAIGQPIVGGGIRPFRYSYDKTAYNNPVTYGGVQNAITFSQPHGIGSIWATMLWDMTWEIILQDGLIGSNNIYDVPANIADYRGNVAAMKLVNEGLRLQPCSPSFVQARDAIFKADQLLFNGRYRCAIGKAFARRGLGYLASSGTSTNDRAVKEDFTEFPVAPLSSPTTVTACSGLTFNYTATTSQIGTFTYSWTRANAAGISTPPASGTGATINEVLVNSTANPVNVQYVISINQTGGASAGCSQTSFQTITVTVIPPLTTIPFSACQSAVIPSGQGVSVPAVAVSTTINGTITTSSPSYVRPDGDNITAYVPGTTVLYKAYYFVAPSSAAFTFATTAGTITDSYISLYQNSFDPANPATNFVAADDDISNTIFLSSLTSTLTAGTTYILVVSGWSANVTGTFTMTSSPGISLQANQWFAAPTGGTPLFTGRVFNPVGVAGSGVPNTSTVGTTTFYVNDLNIAAACRFPVNFNIGSVGGTVTADVASVCSVSNAGTLTLSGHSGTIVRWESSTDNFATNTPIANTTTTLAYTNLTATTQYRAVIQSGTCDPLNSATATITVSNTSVAGTVTGGASVCSTSNSGTLTLTGFTGNISGWQSSTDNFVTNAPIANTTATQTFTNITQNTQYRAVVQNGACVASNSIPATVSLVTLQAGTVTGSSTECASSNSGTLLLTGHSGNVIRWESSTNNFTSVTNIANTSLVQAFNNLLVTTQFRAVIGLSGCTDVTSTPATITVNPAAVGGSVASSASVICLGTQLNLTLTGSTGSVFGWQVTNNNFLSATNINNTTTAITSTPNQSVQYRAVLQSGVCPLAFSNSVGILVTPVPTLSAPSVTQPTCTTQGTIVVNATGVGSTIINGTLTTGDLAQTNRLTRNSTISGCGTPKANPGVTAGTGIIFDKYTFTNPSASPVCISVTLQATNGVNMLAVLYSTHVPTNPSTNYLADFGSSGFQTTFRHTVAGNATVDLVVSSTTSVVANLGAYRLAIDGLTPLEYSINNGTTWQASKTFTGLVPASYTVTARSAPANSCPATLASNPTVLSIQTTSIGGTVSADAAFCTGTIGAGTLTLAGQTGNVVRWESSRDGFVANVVSIPNTTSTYNYSNVTQTTQYRAVVKDGVCAEVNSIPATITIVVPPTPVASGAAIIALGSSATLTTTGCSGAGFAEKWFKTSDNSAVTMPVSPTVTTDYYAKCEQTVLTAICISPKSNDVTITPVVPSANNIYVNQANTNAIQDGTTWAKAYSNLSAGLAGALAGADVWVAQGTYKPTTTTNRLMSFDVPSGVKVYGGFLGNEGVLAGRNVKLNETILSGDIGTMGTYTDDSYHVVKIIDGNNQTLIDGFTVKFGYAANQPPVSNSNSLGSLSALPTSNESGGGIYIQGGNPMVANCTIQNNFAIFGAGIYSETGSVPTIKSCTIAGNFATFGGGVYLLNSNANLNNDLVSGNKGLGAGMFINHCFPMITNVTVAGNDGFVGGIYVTTNPGNESTPIIKNSVIWNNTKTAINGNLAVVSNSIVEGGYLGSGNRNLDPQFVSPTAPAMSPTTTGDYKVANTSPTIDGGNNGAISLTDKDLINNLRRYNGGLVDMGAYEFPGSRVGGTVTSIISGDWDKGTTWDSGVVPLAGDNVIINNNHNVKIIETGTAKNVEIRTNAKIIYNTPSSKLQTGL